MKIDFSGFGRTALIGAALIAAVGSPILQGANRTPSRYHDNGHNDDHEWNNHEDRAYKMWAKENHRKATPFVKLKENDQQSYWGWRHDHSDSVLKINIR